MTVPISPSIFRAYDIRGIVDTELNEQTIYAIGQVIGSTVLEQGGTSLLVARDGRLSGPTLLNALSAGIMASGCHVIDLGLIPTPLLYYAAFTLESGHAVMLTGSHNPSQYNGLKIIMHRQTLTETEIQTIYHRIIQGNVRQGKGHYETSAILESYLLRITEEIRLTRPLKLVVDSGNGATGQIAPLLFRRLGCEVIELFCEIDGRFPNHHPDPTHPDNMQDLIRVVKESQADIGLAFDGDGDRLGVVTSQGEIIWPDRQLMVFAEAILTKQPGATIIYDVKCTHHLGTRIQALGGKPIMWKTGHSFIKRKLLETHAAMAGEMSGHLFFNDTWYGFDDALYAGARLLKILSDYPGDSTALFSHVPNSVNTPELKITVKDEEKFLLMNKLMSHTAHFTDATLTMIDGLRVNFADGWGLVRPSNTTPCLVLRFEAETESGLARIQALFREFLLLVKPDLALSF